MAKVNYVRENTAFIEYASDEHVTANERLLWYALFHLMNRRAIGSDWPDEPISISNARLLSLVPFSEDSLAKARNRLVQRGLIRYEPGKKNTASPRYAINYFCAELSTGNAQNVDVYPDSTGNIGGNMQGNNGGNVQGNNGGNAGGNIGGIIYKPNGIPIVTPDPNAYAEEDSEAAEQVRARQWDAWAEGTVKLAFRSAFGREATPEEISALLVNMRVAPEQARLMPRAIRAAALRGARNPVPYTRTIFAEYVHYHLLSETDVENFEIVQTLRSGRNDVWHVCDGMEKELERQRRKREGLPVDEEEYCAYLRGEG